MFGVLSAFQTTTWNVGFQNRFHVVSLLKSTKIVWWLGWFGEFWGTNPLFHFDFLKKDLDDLIPIREEDVPLSAGNGAKSTRYSGFFSDAEAGDFRYQLSGTNFVESYAQLKGPRSPWNPSRCPRKWGNIPWRTLKLVMFTIFDE